MIFLFVYMLSLLFCTAHAMEQLDDFSNIIKLKAKPPPRPPPPKIPSPRPIPRPRSNSNSQSSRPSAINDQQSRPTPSPRRYHPSKTPPPRLSSSPALQYKVSISVSYPSPSSSHLNKSNTGVFNEKLSKVVDKQARKSSAYTYPTGKNKPPPRPPPITGVQSPKPYPQKLTLPKIAPVSPQLGNVHKPQPLPRPKIKPQATKNSLQQQRKSSSDTNTVLPVISSPKVIHRSHSRSLSSISKAPPVKQDLTKKSIQRPVPPLPQYPTSNEIYTVPNPNHASELRNEDEFEIQWYASSDDIREEKEEPDDGDDSYINMISAQNKDMVLQAIKIECETNTHNIYTSLKTSDSHEQVYALLTDKEEDVYTVPEMTSKSNQDNDGLYIAISSAGRLEGTFCTNPALLIIVTLRGQRLISW